VMQAFSLLPDPQTNGGFLFTVSPGALPRVQALLDANGLPACREPIGVMTERQEKTLKITR
jgi:selenide,water dikinase